MSRARGACANAVDARMAGGLFLVVAVRLARACRRGLQKTSRRPPPDIRFAAMLTAELVPAAIVAAAIAPPLLLLWLVVIADSRPEPARVVLGAVFFGVLSTMVAVVVELGLQKLIPLVHNPWLAAYQGALLFAAIPGEALKFSIIAVLALRARDFDEPMDGVVYGAAVGLRSEEHT